MSKLRPVFGGRVKDRRGLDFVNLNDMDLVGARGLVIGNAAVVLGSSILDSWAQ